MCSMYKRKIENVLQSWLDDASQKHTGSGLLCNHTFLTPCAPDPVCIRVHFT